ncbi:MAG: PP2C family protein-serine/threonine phosphatase [Ruminococcus sp.]|nr:PP2C family protein-serine/threonine phosphatase [Ruminococcus sp.]
MKKKKNHKLLFQISVIILPVFILMAAAVTWAMYHSTVDGFLEAQNSHMEYMIRRIYDYSVNFMDPARTEWFLSEWEKDPELLLEPFTDAEKDEIDRRVNDEDCWSVEWLQHSEGALRSYCMKMYFESVSSALTFESDEENYERIFLMDLSEKHRGLVFCEYNAAKSTSNACINYDLDLSKHPALKNMIETNSVEIAYEQSYDLPEEGSYYIAYKPVTVNGEVRAVLGIVYRWGDFRDTMFATLRKAFFVSIGGIIVALVVLQIMLYRRSVKPVATIQRIVRRYTETKDSAEVIANTSAMKERNELGLLSDDIADLAREIDDYAAENAKLAGERERVAAELDMAKNIQAEQLPNVFPAFPDRNDFDIYASMTPAKEVGGDFYDFFMIDDDHLAMVIADVSGKGIPAALFMMRSKIVISNNAIMGLSPKEILEHANNALCQNNSQRMFVTVWMGILEISTGKVTAASAGHEYPIIRQPDGSFELFKDKHGFVLGGMEDIKYRQYEFTLQRGGTLFVYTDGVPEATDAENNMFGTGRLVETLNRDPGAAPKELLETVHAAVNEFVGEAPQFDDLTMLGIKLL